MTVVTATLIEGSIQKRLFDMSIPMMWGLLATMSFNAVDTFFIGQLGEVPLAAMGFTFPIVMVVISMAIGLGAGTSSAVAYAVGLGDTAAVKRLITDSLSLSVTLTTILIVMGMLSIDPLFRLLGADELVLKEIRAYMWLWYPSAFFMVIPMVVMAAFRAMGDASLQGKSMLLMALANGILDPFLIFGWWGFPRMEIQGAALASLIVRIAASVFILYYLIVRKNLLNNPFNTKGLWASWSRVLKVGLPAMATNMIIPASAALIVAILADQGIDAVAGFGVATRIEPIVLIMFYALSAVIGPFCGQNLAAGQHSRLLQAQWICARFCLASGVVIAVLLGLTGKMISAWFTDSQAVIDVSYSYLMIVPISYGAYGIAMIVIAGFNGLGLPFPAVVLSAARVLFILIPLAWLGNYCFGFWGVFMAMSLTNLCVGLWSYLWIGKTIKQFSA